MFGEATATGLPLYMRQGGEEIGRVVLPERVVRYKKGWGWMGMGEGEVRVKEAEMVLLKWKA